MFPARALQRLVCPLLSPLLCPLLCARHGLLSLLVTCCCDRGTHAGPDSWPMMMMMILTATTWPWQIAWGSCDHKCDVSCALVTLPMSRCTAPLHRCAVEPLSRCPACAMQTRICRVWCSMPQVCLVSRSFLDYCRVCAGRKWIATHFPPPYDDCLALFVMRKPRSA